MNPAPTLSNHSFGRPPSRHELYGLLLLYGCTVGLLSTHLPWWITVIGLGLLLSRGLILIKNQPIPALPLRCFILLSCLAMIMLQADHIQGIHWLPCLLSFGLGIKVLETNTLRDIAIAAVLLWFLWASCLVIDPSLLTTSIIAVLFFSNCHLLLSVNHITTSGSPRLYLKTWRLIILATPLAGLLFIVFPRLNEPLWSINTSRAGQTGMSSAMTIGSINQLTQSTATAFTATFEKAPPSYEQRYWRGLVLGFFDGKTWHQYPTEVLTEQDSVKSTIQSNPSDNYTLQLKPHFQYWVPVLNAAPVLATTHIQHKTVTAQANGTAKAATRINAPLTVQASVSILQTIQQPERTLSATEKLKYLQLPSTGNPLTRQRAQQWQNKSHSARDYIATVLKFYNEQPFRYTLQPLLLGAEPIDDFLFRTQQGFCEHYASSFVTLMRAAQIPARIVIGYQGGQQSFAKNSLTVRQLDAHAWAEVWLKNAGWVRIDPTAAVAPLRIEQGLTAALATEELQLLPQQHSLFAWATGSNQLLQNIWQKWFVQYNQQQQNRILGQVFSQAKSLLKNYHLLANLLIGSIGLWLFLRLLWSLGNHTLRNRSARLTHSWKKLIPRLRAAGLDIAPNLAAQQTANAASEKWPQLALPLNQIVHHYNTAKFAAEADHRQQQAFYKNIRILRRRLLLIALQHKLQRICQYGRCSISLVALFTQKTPPNTTTRLPQK